jgi:4-hydroxyphenylpyruvate dioxygenase
VYNKAVERGAVSYKAPEVLKDEHGSVIVASVKTYGDTVHTFVQRVDYTGPFLPGFKAHHLKEVLNEKLPPIELKFIDHVVGN